MERAIPLPLAAEASRSYRDETPQGTFKRIHFDSICGPKDDSMKITKDIREIAKDGAIVRIDEPCN
ncbi:MAG: hypothetical protein CMJ77_18355 [Planctomycetaceae bacterium]|nr:hypothetical protein [Planctomycetaceae bacterium]